MRPVLTVGITSHNEKNNISGLLDQLSLLDENLIEIVLYDDASTDGTATLVAEHPISKKPNFEAHLAEANFGSPSKGRKYIAEQAKSPYVTFVDGDDLIDAKALTAIARRLPQGFDIIVTPFMSGKRLEFPALFNNDRPISNDTIARILSGIGGKIYNREALILHTLDSIKGRSEDVRLNMRIILGGFDRIRLENTKPFYFITASRKSTLAKNILLHEIAARVSNYQILKERYGVDDVYIKGLHRNLLKVVREDPSLGMEDRLERYRAIHDAMPFRLKRIIHLVQNTSDDHDYSRLVRDTLAAATGRDIQYVCIAAHKPRSQAKFDALIAEGNEVGVYTFLYGCHTTDTAVVAARDVVQHFTLPLREQFNRLPLLHLAVDPLLLALEDSEALADLDFVDSYKAARILCLSEMDMSFHRQMGIADVAKITLPVAGREHNTYTPERNRFVTYVGRIDFRAKEAGCLVSLAKLMKERGLPPLQVFTSASNPPDLPDFRARLAEAGLSDWVAVHDDATDEDAFAQASVVLLPSRKEAFDNVLLKALSFGVPVIANRYAPGPAEAIRSGEDGLLLGDFSAEAVVSLLQELSPERLSPLSKGCFERHREFSMERYLSSLEAHAAEIVREFPGHNTVKVFPHLRAAEVLTTQNVWPFLMRRFRVKRKWLAFRIFLVEKVLPKRVTKALRWLKAKLRG